VSEGEMKERLGRRRFGGTDLESLVGSSSSIREGSGSERESSVLHGEDGGGRSDGREEGSRCGEVV